MVYPSCDIRQIYWNKSSTTVLTVSCYVWNVIGCFLIHFALYCTHTQGMYFALSPRPPYIAPQKCDIGLHWGYLCGFTLELYRWYIFSQPVYILLIYLLSFFLLHYNYTITQLDTVELVRTIDATAIIVILSG